LETPRLAAACVASSRRRLAQIPHPRAICLTGFSALQSSTQHDVVKSILAKPLNPDRTIALVIGHEEASGVYDRVPRGRAKTLTPPSRALRMPETGRRGFELRLDMLTASA
jgi:hypothetical protein